MSTASLLERNFRAMASEVRVRVDEPAPHVSAVAVDAGLTAIEDLFRAVEKECTRFDESSDLMRANATGTSWVSVGEHCYAALTAAYRAHRRTGGLFDPRVLTTLRALGYGATLPFAAGEVRIDTDPASGTAGERVAAAAGSWAPRFDPESRRVQLGPEPIDLGGIAKGYAVHRTAELLAPVAASFLVDAGGDCHLGGRGPVGDGWHVGVEDPFGGATPVAVLRISSSGCATTSIRLRHWTVGDRQVHHVIDPRTSDSSRSELRSVTVVHPDAMWAEVWAKVLFLHGADIGVAAAANELAALWVHADGQLDVSSAMSSHLVWRAAA